MKKTNRKVSVFEIVWYTLTGLLAVWGLTYIVLGVVARNSRADSAIAKASSGYAKAMGLDFYGWGLILLAIGVVLMVIVLLANAKKADREVEKQQRRAARLAAANAVEQEKPAIEE